MHVCFVLLYCSSPLWKEICLSQQISIILAKILLMFLLVTFNLSKNVTVGIIQWIVVLCYSGIILCLYKWILYGFYFLHHFPQVPTWIVCFINSRFFLSELCFLTRLFTIESSRKLTIDELFGLYCSLIMHLSW